MKTLFSAIFIIILFPIAVKLTAIIFWAELFRQLEYKMDITDIHVEEVEDDAL